MKIGLCIPTRGDRPQFLKVCKNLIQRQTVQPDEIYFVDFPGQAGVKDITLRYRKGLEELTKRGCDIALLWEDDDWYWREEATDWGYTWREPEKKYLHPKYAPVHRYARDIIGCLNHWVNGWIDWNMVLDRQGGPNWFENWCVAPVLVDPDQDAIYFTPLYYVMCHFSKFIRPGFVVIQHSCADQDIMATAIKADENRFVVVLFNPTKEPKHIQIKVIDQIYRVDLTPQAIQTIILNN